MRLKIGWATLKIVNRPRPNTGMIAKNIRAISLLILTAIITEKMTIKGALTAILMIIIKAFCTLETSLVSLVTSEEEEKSSMSLKENSWTW